MKARELSKAVERFEQRQVNVRKGRPAKKHPEGRWYLMARVNIPGMAWGEMFVGSRAMCVLLAKKLKAAEVERTPEHLKADPPFLYILGRNWPPS